MRFKHLPLLSALALAAPAFAVTVNMTDFVYPGTASVVSVSSTDGGPTYSGEAGEFVGVMSDSAFGAAAAASTQRAAFTDATTDASFHAWCAELTQSFSFGVVYQYQLDTGASYFGATRNDALSRLFTAAQGFVVDRLTSAALQAGIWEIIYEHSGSYDLTAGSFTGSLQDPAGLLAFNTVNGFLTHLSTYAASYRIDVLENGAAQDFIIPTAPVPEPETWALLMAGLGAMGWAARRKQAGARAD